ncbi:hypothetical protein F5148DRAFT_1186994 [Russula earlei]|uniref:Uncharacterized protein n=1 Tax=Russula earlei TaxID=71964 RepID=A0ACC0UDE0_9AGAM|nr:hypothetical protein F5148DRAFT_1186994 [Russula earlei]
MTAQLMSTMIYFFISYTCQGSQCSRCGPRICLNVCDFVRAESTERQGLVLGSSLSKQAAPTPTAVFNLRNCDGTPNQAKNR